MFISDGPQIMQSMILVIVSEHFHAIIVVKGRTVVYHKYGHVSCIMIKISTVVYWNTNNPHIRHELEIDNMKMKKKMKKGKNYTK